MIISFLASCTEKVGVEQLHLLNGYWEIESVSFADGNNKTYGLNPMVDYIELEGLKGFKKKAQTKFDGTYTVTDDAEYFTIMEKGGILSMQYNNKMSQWGEEITGISETHFSVINQDGVTYIYKRYQPINANK